MKFNLYTYIALAIMLLASLKLQAQTTSDTPPDASKHASSTNYTEGDIYYVKQLPSGEYTGTMFDKEGNEYPVATFSTVWWTTWNMRSITYSDGTIINGGVPSAPNDTYFDAHFCYPSSTGAITKTDYWDKSQGLLYNHRGTVKIFVDNNNEGGADHEVRKGICPSGWHVPSDLEWTGFTTSLGDDTVAGTLIKSGTRLAGSTTNTEGTSASADMGGFNLLLAGGAQGDYASNYGSSTDLWSSSSYGGSYHAYSRTLYAFATTVYRSNLNPSTMLSVRCKK